MLFNSLGGFFGFLTNAYISDRLGRRQAFRYFAVGFIIAVNLYIFLPLGNSAFTLLPAGFVYGFFQFGIYASFGPYFTELFPTEVRATGQAFAYNFGRASSALVHPGRGHADGLHAALLGHGDHGLHRPVVRHSRHLLPARNGRAPVEGHRLRRMTGRPTPDPRTAYRHFRAIPTRWMDNDVYGHVNNVVYYSYFDTVVNQYLIEAAVLDIERGPVIGLVVETHCNYFSPITFPDTVHAGLRVARLGSSSVRYEVGLFRNDDLSRPRRVISSTCTWIEPTGGPSSCPTDSGRH